VGRRLAIVMAVLAVGAGACGGGAFDGATSEGTLGAEETAADVASGMMPTHVAEEIVAALGPDRGFAAVLYAFDAGYSVTQIAAAGLAGTLGADGEIAGVDPLGSEFGLVAAPETGNALPAEVNALPVARSVPAKVLAAGEERTPEEAWGEFNLKLAEAASIDLLGAGLGLSGDVDYADVFPAPSPATVEAAEVMISVLLKLMDVGYTFDQAFSGFLFGEWQMAVAVDTTGESFTGVEMGGNPVTACLVLRDDAGSAVRPEGTGTGVFFGSDTCRNALRDGTVSFADEPQPGSEGDETGAAAPSPEPNEHDAGYTFQAVLDVGDDVGSVYVTWSGSFDIVDSAIVGSGTAAASSEGECWVEDGPKHPYAFSIDWEFDISGSSDGAQLRPTLSRRSGSGSLQAGAGTNLDEFCVELSGDLLESIADLPLGATPEVEIAVPVSGGSVTTGVDPFPITVTVTPTG
jgi:hypothetical protein